MIRFFASRWKPVMWTVLVLVCMAQSAVLGREVALRLSSLSIASNDDIRWNMTQLEVDLLRVQREGAQIAPGGDLTAFRTRYDIFYSRVDTLVRAAMYRGLRGDDHAREILQQLVEFLEKTTPLVDGPDAMLVENVTELQAEMADLHPDTRELALIGVRLFAQQADTLRQGIRATLVQLAIAVFALIVVLGVSVAVLLRLYQHHRSVSQENAVVKARFEAAVTSSLDAVLVTDTHGRIIEFNGAAEAVFGYTRDEVLGGDMASLIVPPHLRARHRAGMRRYLDTGETRVIDAGRIRIEAMRKTGEVFPVELSISKSEAGDQPVFVSFLRDITPELLAEEELRSARDKAEAGEKAKAQLLTVMSHEMRTPLNGVLGSLDLIERDALTSRQKRLLKAVRVSGELLLSHVNDVLDLSRLASGTTAPRNEMFDLGEMAAELISSLQPAAQERGNTLAFEQIGDEFGTVHGDRIALQQCLVNLIGNAIKFTRDGSVMLEVERLGARDLVEFRIIDTGLGIPADKLEGIFQEFVTIDTDYARENPGTGLGLAITKRLVQAMAGEIAVESIQGEGSLFSMHIPLRQAGRNADLLVKSTPENEVYAAQALSVLIVEDNEINRMILEDMLVELGCTVDCASNGYEGVRRANERAYDMIFLDISMPGKDGIQTLHEIRSKRGPSCRASAVAVTAHAGADDRRRFMEADFEAVMTKPITLVGLARVLSEHGRCGTGPTVTDEQNSVSQDFIARFGEQAFVKHLGGFTRELEELEQLLTVAEVLNERHRRQAHQLAGTAAVLGLGRSHRTLQSVEACTPEQWRDQKESLIKDLALQAASGCAEAFVAAG